MSITIKCFAALREQLGGGMREMEFAENMTAADAWRALSDAPPPANLLCARNLQYVALDARLEDGDEVAFFPPVTGG